MYIVAIARVASGQIMFSCVMPIGTFPKRNSPASLLRESVRKGKRPTKRTIANLSVRPVEPIEMIRRLLEGREARRARSRTATSRRCAWRCGGSVSTR